MLETPVLFLIFNREDTAQKVFDAIREQKPKYLFVAADGARKNKPNEAEKCKQVRNIIKQIDWDCWVIEMTKRQLVAFLDNDKYITNERDSLLLNNMLNFLRNSSYKKYLLVAYEWNGYSEGGVFMPPDPWQPPCPPEGRASPPVEIPTVSGTTGQCTWTISGFEDDRTLIISGAGEMENYRWDTAAPWSSHRFYIKTLKIADGVTSIGDRAFFGLSSIKSVIIPDGATIGYRAFYGCYSLAAVTIRKSVFAIKELEDDKPFNINGTYILRYHHNKKEILLFCNSFDEAERKMDYLKTAKRLPDEIRYNAGDWEALCPFAYIGGYSYSTKKCLVYAKKRKNQ